MPAKSRAFRVTRSASIATAETPIAMSAARRRGEPRLLNTSAETAASSSEKGTMPSSKKNDRATASCSGVRGPRENSYQATERFLEAMDRVGERGVW